MTLTLDFLHYDNNSNFGNPQELHYPKDAVARISPRKIAPLQKIAPEHFFWLHYGTCLYMKGAIRLVTMYLDQGIPIRMQYKIFLEYM